MHGTMTDLFSWPGEFDLAIFQFYFNISVDRLLQFAFWSFYGNQVICTNGKGYPGWDFYRLFSYTTHFI